MLAILFICAMFLRRRSRSHRKAHGDNTGMDGKMGTNIMFVNPAHVHSLGQEVSGNGRPQHGPVAINGAAANSVHARRQGPSRSGPTMPPPPWAEDEDETDPGVLPSIYAVIRPTQASLPASPEYAELDDGHAVYSSDVNSISVARRDGAVYAVLSGDHAIYDESQT